MVYQEYELIALSHIRVSAAYRSHIYKNFDTPRSEPYFARATYVPRTCDVPATFQWRIRDVSVFVWNFTFVCTAYLRRMCYVRVTYVWRMKCTRDVSTAYVLRSILICGVSVLYQLLFNTYENKRLCSLCSCNLHITVINYQRSKMPPEMPLIDELAKNMQTKKQTDLILLDFSKAFDKFAHSEKLLLKLHF